jgi:EAL domain-containing protein (putative c-di-GMP-specific phosphodiesterase class I)
VARILEHATRDEDVVARVGGDEFAVCLSGLDAPEQAATIADTLHDRLNQPIPLGDRAVFAPASIGGVDLADYDDADAVLRAADTALHEAKKIPHRAFVAYAPGMIERADTQLALDTALRRALNQSEFVPFFQPIVDLSDGHLHGFEVLARWDHPEKGLLAPDLFLETAEATGLIVPIGHQVIRKACAAVGALSSRRGEAPSLTANFSRQEFFRADTHAFLTDLFDTYDLTPRHFTMEISERTVTGITPEDVTAFRALKNLGVSILLDDFGTGISSLQSLRRLPVDGLKIDKGLLAGAHGRSWDRDLVDLIVQMGHTLDQTVTAEGVETRPQLGALRRMGCTYGQGYLLARPAPASRLESLLDEPFRTTHWSA